MTIGGALIATSGFALSVFASNVTVLTLTYGVIGGECMVSVWIICAIVKMKIAWAERCLVPFLGRKVLFIGCWR